MTAVRFDSVWKTFPLEARRFGGLKDLVVRPRRAWASRRVSRVVALQNVSFEVRRGEAVGLIGENGSGKSTTLGLAAGVLRADRGTVEVSGRVRAVLELGAGFHPELTGRENIFLNGVLLGLTRREVTERLEAIAGFSELGRLLDQPLRTYSSGMAARLGFSVAAHLDPEILLIDEVFAVGDLAFQAKCRRKLEELKKQNVTIILVSHALQDVREFCSRAIWLRAGRVVSDGKTDLVVSEYEREFGRAVTVQAGTGSGGDQWA
jgi:lipopolysaccharide transport system ATP-binding protein